MKRTACLRVMARIAAARVCGCMVLISIPGDLKNHGVEFIQKELCAPLMEESTLRFESDADLIERIPKVQGIRYAGPERTPDAVLRAAAKFGFYIAREPVLMEGRIELLHYLKNQSICDMYHRYGNLGDRGLSLG